MLEGLYRMTGRPTTPPWRPVMSPRSQNLPPEVVTATGLFADGDLDAAETMVRAYLLKHGDHIEAMRLLAHIGMARNVLDDAELLLAAVLELAPDYRPRAMTTPRCSSSSTSIRQARRADRPAAQGGARQPASISTLMPPLPSDSASTSGPSRFTASCSREPPEHADLHLSMAHALKTLGRQQDADRGLSPGRGRAGRTSAMPIGAWPTSRPIASRMRSSRGCAPRRIGAATALADRYHLCFALGKALEDRGEYRGILPLLRAGQCAQARRKPLPPRHHREQYAPADRGLHALISSPRRRGWGAPSPDPIFIVGLPRSGSTLIEQILASHSQVEGTQELADIQQIVGNLRGRDPDPNNPRYPRILARAERGGVSRSSGEHYLADTRVYRTGKPFFIDKMPNNFRHLGLIHLMLPNARIIDARREPMACCFSNLKQLFANGQEFTYSIEDIARYYRTYLELMRHWDRVLPGRILRVHHEDVVDDLEGNVRRMLDFCGLEFEPHCIEFHKTERSVRTASSEQVRQPIFREGLDQWKNFEPWLEPLKERAGRRVRAATAMTRLALRRVAGVRPAARSAGIVCPRRLWPGRAFVVYPGAGPSLRPAYHRIGEARQM